MPSPISNNIFPSITLSVLVLATFGCGEDAPSPTDPGYALAFGASQGLYGRCFAICRRFDALHASNRGEIAKHQPPRPHPCRSFR